MPDRRPAADCTAQWARTRHRIDSDPEYRARHRARCAANQRRYRARRAALGWGDR